MPNTNTQVPAVPEVIEGTVIPKGAVLFVRESDPKIRAKVQAEEISTLRTLRNRQVKTDDAVLTQMVRVLVNGTVTNGDDALAQVQKGKGALSLNGSKVSQARAAFYAVTTLGIPHSGTDEWEAVLHAAGHLGVGKGRWETALKAKGGKAKVLTAVKSAAAEKGSGKRDGILRKALPSPKSNETGTASWRKAERGVQAIEEAIGVEDDKAKMTDDERESLRVLLANILSGIPAEA